MNKINNAIQAAAAADKAVASYDSYIFASVGRPFDDLKADLLAADAAEACRKAVTAGRGFQPAWFLAEYSAKAAEFKSIAGSLA